MCFAWGIADVQGWLEQVQPEVLDFWEAFDRVEPIGEHWRQTAQLTTMVERLIEYTAAINGAKGIRPSTIDDNMPARYARPVKPKQIQQPKPPEPQQQFHNLAAFFGLSKIVAKHNGRSN